jgi:hypothetical protein
VTPPRSLPDSTRLLAAALDTLENTTDYCKAGASAHGPILVEGAVWCYKCGAIRMPGETNWTHPKGRR